MDNRPVGIFDSGLGGLTAVREFQKLMPDESIVYFGDTGRMPYGVRPASQIHIIAGQNLDFVSGMAAKTMIAACGTISSTADDVLLASKTPVCGVLKPGCARLAETAYPAVGVIATATSIQSGAYERRLSSLAPDKKIISAACPDFVPLIEAGRFSPEDGAVMAAVEKYLTPMKKAGIGALLLGCTHYGLIGEAIDKFFDGRVELIGASECAAAAMRDYIAANGLAAEKKTAPDRFFTSGDVGEFEALGRLFLGRDITGLVEYVPPFPV